MRRVISSAQPPGAEVGLFVEMDLGAGSYTSFLRVPLALGPRAFFTVSMVETDRVPTPRPFWMLPGIFTAQRVQAAMASARRMSFRRVPADGFITRFSLSTVLQVVGLPTTALSSTMEAICMALAQPAVPATTVTASMR